MEGEKHFLSVEEIASTDDIEVREVFVPEWKGWVRVRTLTGAQRNKLEKSLVEGKGKNRDVNMERFRSRLVAMSCVNDNGKRLFSDAQADMLEQKSAAAIERIVNVAKELSGFSEEDVEDLVGESKAEDGSGSFSSSPENEE